MKGLIVLCNLLLAISTNAFAQSKYITNMWQTDNGAKVIYYYTQEPQMLEINVAFKAGSMFDGDDHGLSALTTRLLHLGSGNLTANEVAKQLDETGAQYSYDTSRDMSVLSLKTLTKPDALNKAVDIFALILNKPTFSESEFEREKQTQLIEIKNNLDSPDEIANQKFFQILYKNHPYAHPVIGDAEHVKKITLEKVKNFHKKYFTANNATIVIVGSIDYNQARKFAAKLTQHLPHNQKLAQIPKPLPVEQNENFEIKYPSTQTVIRLGQLGIDYNDPDYFKLIVGNYLLGSGNLVSRLGTELREKRGLTYGIYSQFLPMLTNGPFIISLATKNDQKNLATNLTRQTLEGFLQSGPEEAELLAAKKYLTGSFPLALASNHSIAMMLLKIAFYNLPEDYLDTYTKNINAVSSHEIRKAMQKIIVPNKLIQIAVGG